VDEWSKAFDKMTSLKKLSCRGMREYIVGVDESIFLDEKNSSTVEYPDDERQRIYWNDKTFPDAMIKEEDVKKLEEATHAEDICFNEM